MKVRDYFGFGSGIMCDGSQMQPTTTTTLEMRMAVPHFTLSTKRLSSATTCTRLMMICIRHWTWRIQLTKMASRTARFLQREKD